MLPLQQITNTGSTRLNVPYTLAIYNPSYALIAGQAWNWGASGSATNGTFSGPITMVRIPDIHPCQSFGLGCELPWLQLGCPLCLLHTLSGLQADRVRVLGCLGNAPRMGCSPPV